MTTAAKMFPEAVEAIYLRLLREYGEVVFTGSRAMKVATRTSDWDFVVVGDEAAAVREGWTQYGPHGSPQGDLGPDGGWSVYVVGYELVNIIVVPTADRLLQWAMATDWCCEHGNVEDKRVRCRVFDHFFGIECRKYDDPCPVCGRTSDIPF